MVRREMRRRFDRAGRYDIEWFNYVHVDQRHVPARGRGENRVGACGARRQWAEAFRTMRINIWYGEAGRLGRNLEFSDNTRRQHWRWNFKQTLSFVALNYHWTGSCRCEGQMHLKSLRCRSLFGYRLLASWLISFAASIWPVEGKIIKFDPPQSVRTEPLSINRSGVIAGLYLTNTQGKPRGFLRSPDGTITTFGIKGAKCGTDPLSINDNAIMTGAYKDSSCNSHGFIRAADGTI